MFLKPFFFQKHSLSLFFLQKMFNSVSHIFWTRPDDRMIIPVKFQTHRINDLIHQDQTEKAKHWKKTNNSRKPHSKWTSLGFDAQQWLTQTRCWRSQWASYFTKQGQMCPFKGSPTVSPVTVFLCVSEPLSWSGSRSPAEIHFFAVSHGARQQARTINFRPESCDKKAEDHQGSSCQHFVQEDFVDKLHFSIPYTWISSRGAAISDNIIRNPDVRMLPSTSRVATDQAPPDQKTPQCVPGSVP